MIWLKAFVSGLLATLIFHQGLFAVFYFVGMVPSAPFNMAAVPPLGIPAVFSLAFFGGLWGVVLWAILGRFGGFKFWLGIDGCKSVAVDRHQFIIDPNGSRTTNEHKD